MLPISPNRKPRLTQLAICCTQALFHDSVAEAINCQSVQEIAKVLGTGPNRLFKFMREEGLLMPDSLPTGNTLTPATFGLSREIQRRAWG